MSISSKPPAEPAHPHPRHDGHDHSSSHTHHGRSISGPSDGLDYDGAPEEDDEDGLIVETAEQRRTYQESREFEEDGDFYDDYPDRKGRGGYVDLDRDDRRSHEQGWFGKDRPPKGQGRPVDTIVVEGIPEGFGLNEVRTSFYNSTDLVDFPTVQIRYPGGKRAFLQFQSLTDSIKWMEANFPRVNLEFPSRSDSQESSVSCFIHYARTSSTANPSNTKNSMASQIAPNVSDNSWRQQLNGATDAGTTPSQTLVFYPLPRTMDEAGFLAGVQQLEKEESSAPKAAGAPKLKSTAPVGSTVGMGAKRGTLHRVMIMRDTATNVSMNYGFAEFWTIDEGMAALAKFNKSRAFSMDGATVMVSTIHLGVFVPEEREVTPNIEMQSFCPLINPGIRVRYRDLHVYPSILMVNETPPAGLVLPIIPEEEKKVRKRKGENLTAGPNKKPVIMAGQIAVWTKKYKEISETAGSGGNMVPVGTTKGKGITISLGRTNIGAEEDLSYLDLDQLACLLCMMRYRSVEDCHIHEASRNHKRAMKDEERVKLAGVRVTKRDRKRASESYRDRAFERRKAFNMPSQPQKALAPVESKPVEPEQPPPEPRVGKGSSLLAKMGWTAGSGLGANGSGRTDIIRVNAYQEGVGLGVEGGNLGDAVSVAGRKMNIEVSKAGGKRFDYLGTGRDRARERFKALGKEDDDETDEAGEAADETK